MWQRKQETENVANPESACFASTSDQPGQELSNSLPLRGKY
jgi:hypothetical protein